MNVSPLNLAKDLIPAHLHKNTWIAGGATVNADPRDVDIWVIVSGEEEKNQVSKYILSHLAAAHLDVDLFDPAQYAWSTNRNNISKIGSVDAYGKPCQVMVWIGEDIYTLLDSFDLSIHAHAVNLNTGQRVSGPRATHLESGSIRVQDFSRASSTLRRYVRLCDRYKVIPNREDVLNLATRIRQDAIHKAEEEVNRSLRDLGVSQ